MAKPACVVHVLFFEAAPNKMLRWAFRPFRAQLSQQITPFEEFIRWRILPKL